MAILVTHLDNVIQGAGASIASNSVSPGTDHLLLAAVGNYRTTGGIATFTVETPTVSGLGLTWVQVATTTFGIGISGGAAVLAERQRVTVFRAMGTPTPGAVTADFGGVSQGAAAIFIAEVRGVDTSGTNGSGAVQQSATSATAINDAPTATASRTAALSAFASTGNGAFAAAMTYSNASTINPDTDWTELQEVGSATLGRFETQWRADNDTTAVATFASGTTYWGVVALELVSGAVTLDAAGTGSATLSAVVRYRETCSAAGVGAATLTATVKPSLAAAGTGAASLASVVVIPRIAFAVGSSSQNRAEDYAGSRTTMNPA